MTITSKILDLIEHLRAQSESYCVVTILRTADSTSARPGAKAVITSTGELHGFVGGNCVTGAVKRAALECLQTGQPKMIRIKPNDDVVSPVDVDGVQLHRSNCPSGGTVEVFIEPRHAARKLLICGASPIAQSILLLARGLGYRIVVAADKQDHQDMAGADVYLSNFEFDDLALSATDAAIVATQGKQDRDALRAILLSEAGYKGMVCSGKKRQALMQQLVLENSKFQALDSDLHAPAGIYIGAIEPEEIALSVVSEIVACQRLGVQATERSPQTDRGLHK